MEKEVLQRCDNCLKQFPQSKMATHFGYCRRNIKKCPTCGEMYDINFAEQHEEQYHKKQPCQYCKIIFPSQELKPHEGKCDKKPKYCQYCDLNVPPATFASHLKQCQSRTKPCTKCNKPITNKDYLIHIVSCPGYIEQPKPSRSYQDHINQQQARITEEKKYNEKYQNRERPQDNGYPSSIPSQYPRNTEKLMEKNYAPINNQKKPAYQIRNEPKPTIRFQNGIQNQRPEQARYDQKIQKKYEPRVQPRVIQTKYYNNPPIQTKPEVRKEVSKPTQVPPTKNQYKREEYKREEYKPTNNRVPVSQVNKRQSVEKGPIKTTTIQSHRIVNGQLIRQTKVVTSNKEINPQRNDPRVIDPRLNDPRFNPQTRQYKQVSNKQIFPRQQELIKEHRSIDRVIPKRQQPKNYTYEHRVQYKKETHQPSVTPRQENTRNYHEQYDLGELGVTPEDHELQMAIMQSMGQHGSKSSMYDFSDPALIEQQRLIEEEIKRKSRR